MITPFRLSAITGAIAICGALSGCWLDSDPVDSSGQTVTPPVGTPPTASATVAGQVYASTVSGAVVSVFAADASGAATGSALATATTDAHGAYSLTLATVPTGPVLLVATGGTYVSEADGSTQTLGTFATLVPQLNGGANTVQINPVTNTIAAAAASQIKANGGTLAAAVSGATAAVNKLFGLGALSADPGTVAADPSAATGDPWLLAALAGTLEQLRANSSVPAAALYEALRNDAADGKLDGLNNGQPITLGSGGPTLASSLFTTQWSGAANAFGAAQPQFAAATASISGALQASAQAVGIAIGSSGSIAPLQTQAGGSQLYFAARADGLVRLDMSDPANPVASKMTAINDAVMRNTSVTPATGYFTSLDGIVIDPTPINTPGGVKVFAVLYSYASKTVVTVNLTDGVVADTATLSIANPLSFSGAIASIAGGIADGKRGRIWLATGDGLIGLDPSNLKATAVVIPQPAGTQINENLGGDPAKDIVYSPDYLNRGLVVFNLQEAKAYTMGTTEWGTSVGTFAATGQEVDGVSLDSQYNVAVMTPEGGGLVGVMAYTTPSGATTTIGSIPAVTKFKAFSTGGSFAGSAIDPVTHTGLFVGEGSGLGVGVLDDPNGTGWNGFGKFVRASVSSYRFEPHDPHTVGAFNIAGKPYGFVLQGTGRPYKVGVINLNAWLAAPTSGGALITDPLADTGIARLVGY